MAEKKKAYARPEVQEVKLAVEEAMLTGCKIGSGSARTQLCNKNSGPCVNSSAGS